MFYNYRIFIIIRRFIDFHINVSELPDPVDHATGLEKKELLAALAGNDDPYHMKAIKRGVGTKDKPTLIPSAFDARMLGCICMYYFSKLPNMNYECYSFYSHIDLYCSSFSPNLNMFFLYSRSRRSDLRPMDVAL